MAFAIVSAGIITVGFNVRGSISFSSMAVLVEMTLRMRYGYLAPMISAFDLHEVADYTTAIHVVASRQKGTRYIPASRAPETSTR